MGTIQMQETELTNILDFAFWILEFASYIAKIFR